MSIVRTAVRDVTERVHAAAGIVSLDPVGTGPRHIASRDTLESAQSSGWKEVDQDENSTFVNEINSGE